MNMNETDIIDKEVFPKVSVCVITYNHEKHIRLCLQSIIDQVSDFSFEVIVGDDFSTDGTREIIREFVEKYPKIVKPIFHKKNIGGNQNYFSVHGSAKGLYVAHIDGDDYALPGKLQIQADKLDQDLSLNIVWHRMNFVSNNGVQRNHPDLNAPYLNVNITRGDLMLYGPIGQHSSTMYRKKLFSLRYANEYAIDWLFSVELISDGIGLIMPDVLGGYRVHSGGLTGGAVSSSKYRHSLCSCQLELLQRFPEYQSLIALRSLFTAALDFILLRKYYTKSLNVFIRAKTAPAIFAIPKLLTFYKFSKLPNEFKL
jgi:glycosyltransferase involved in cell wall biosynthesis